jgi:hypothetical protein
LQQKGVVMHLNLLANGIEKLFFLSLSYLIAVADPEEDPSLIPLCKHRELTYSSPLVEKDNPDNFDDPLNNIYRCNNFTPGFEMQISELLFLRSFSLELSVLWSPIYDYYHHYSDCIPSNTPNTRLADNYSSNIQYNDSVKKILDSKFPFINKAIKNYSNKIQYSDTFSINNILSISISKNIGYYTDIKRSFLELLLMEDLESRLDILKSTLALFVAFFDLNLFSLDSKKVILFNLLQMALVDGNYSSYKQNLIEEYCIISNLEKTFIDEFFILATNHKNLYDKILTFIK